LKLEQIDVIELNEAFAVQSLCGDSKRWESIPRGSIPTAGPSPSGHPLGCTGAKPHCVDPARTRAPQCALWHGYDVHRGGMGAAGIFERIA